MIVRIPKNQNGDPKSEMNKKKFPYWNCKLDREGFLHEIVAANKLSSG